jgi:hypothetical protein
VNVVGHTAVVVAVVLVTPVVMSVAQTTDSTHVEVEHALAVLVSPKFVTEQSTWQFVTVELVAQLLVAEDVGELVGAELTSPPSSFASGVHPEPVHPPLEQLAPEHDCSEQSGPVQEPVLASQSVSELQRQSSCRAQDETPCSLPGPMHPRLMQFNPVHPPPPPQSAPTHPEVRQPVPEHPPLVQPGPMQPITMQDVPLHRPVLWSQSSPVQPKATHSRPMQVPLTQSAPLHCPFVTTGKAAVVVEAAELDVELLWAVVDDASDTGTGISVVITDPSDRVDVTRLSDTASVVVEVKGMVVIAPSDRVLVKSPVMTVLIDDTSDVGALAGVDSDTGTRVSEVITDPSDKVLVKADSVSAKVVVMEETEPSGRVLRRVCVVITDSSDGVGVSTLVELVPDTGTRVSEVITDPSDKVLVKVDAVSAKPLVMVETDPSGNVLVSVSVVKVCIVPLLGLVVVSVELALVSVELALVSIDVEGAVVVDPPTGTRVCVVTTEPSESVEVN